MFIYAQPAELNRFMHAQAAWSADHLAGYRMESGTAESQVLYPD